MWEGSIREEESLIFYTYAGLLVLVAEQSFG